MYKMRRLALLFVRVIIIAAEIRTIEFLLQPLRFALNYYDGIRFTVEDHNKYRKRSAYNSQNPEHLRHLVSMYTI